jgi:SAM-dependent methyltransferase
MTKRHVVGNVQCSPDDVDADNIDVDTVRGFGEEWQTFDQSGMPDEEHRRIFADYFSCFPFGTLSADAEGFDLGCGSGRWAVLVAPRVGTLHCVDPSEKALDVARGRLGACANVRFHHAGAHAMPMPDASQDFGYSLGVLHHIPDTAKAMRDCVIKLKPGAPFLVYLYYAFDNKPAWFRTVWRVSDGARRVIARLPFASRRRVTDVIAATVYWPLTRVARLVERLGGPVDCIPLAPYRNYAFYTMRTDALDRFGTRLERRFTKAQVAAMMEESGLEDLVFRDGVPYWVACGRRASA